MPRYFSIDIACTSCDHEWHELIDVKDKDGEFPCIRCSGVGKRTMSAPNVMRNSYRDGTNRFKDAKEAAKLNKAAASAQSSETKKEIAKEIKKLGYKFDKSIISGD
jgi:hypothetical protein